MIDLEHEKPVLLSKSGRVINPSNPPHTSSIWRWASSGVRGGIRLETVRVGGRVYTSREAIFRFIARLNAPRDCRPAQPEPPSTRAQRAVERCKAIGV